MDGIFVSPFTTAPKAGDVAGAIRTCHHLSAGGKLSVNAGIDFDPLNPIGLLQVDSVVARVQYLMQLHPGRRVFGAKCDMAQYFRQIPLRRRDMARMAQRWKGEVYVHEAFTFGSRSAPHVCSIITNALCDEMARRGHWCHCFIDDCGVIVNPMLVEGQVHGGIASGVAQALYEEIRYDGDGNPLTTNLADYGCISAAELPSFEISDTVTPTTANPIGAKGVGESGTTGSVPAVQNAVVDALAHLGVRHIDLPLTAERVWRIVVAATPSTEHD